MKNIPDGLLDDVVKRLVDGLQFIILSSFFIISGCTFLNQPNTVTKNSASDISKGTEVSLPITFQLHDVPHNPRKQKGTDCAPDSLRMVLNYRGKNVGEADIVRQLKSRGFGGGTSFSQIQEIAVKDYGLPSFVIHNCDLDTIKSAIMNKWPPIIGYRASGKYYHAVVAVGYDDDKKLMFVHDPNVLSVKKIRYSDLGGFESDGTQRLSVLLVLPAGLTDVDLANGLAKYVPKEILSKLVISAMFPS
ncbi:MAG: Peptidase 2 protein [Candidatus Poribacteria bacterium]|nr:Peptidase 2 protein [Candidatus Poribacteria bacterium]